MVSAASFHIALEGSVGCIRLSPKAAEEFAEVCRGKDNRSVSRRRSLERAFDHFCNRGPKGLGEEKFKRQGQFSAGEGRTVVVWEFKAFAWRVYGSLLHVNGRHCFVGVRVDPDKKQDRANPETLRLTALAIGELDEFKAIAKTSGAQNEKRKGRS